MLDECRDFLAERLATVARNAGMRDASVIAALRKGACEFFDDLVAGRDSGFAEARGLTASKIRLVDHDQLEFAIALTDLSSKLTEHCGGQLARLQLRMMTLLDTDRYEADSNPVGAATVCAGIDAACAEIGGSLADLLALLERLKAELLAELPGIYTGMDELLMRRRVAPRALPRATADGGGRPRDLGARVGQPAGDSLAALRGALLGRAAPRVDASGARGVVVDPAIAAMLLERALGELDAAQRASPADGPAPAQNVLRAMKSAQVAPQLDAAGAASFDALAMVFDEILDAPQLPDAIKAIIGRLQIPLLKVALLDAAFLSDAAHPARRLLDSMAAAVAGLPETIGGDHPVCVKLRSAAAVVQTEFERDVGVFARMGDELDDFVAQREQRAQADAGRYLALAQQADARELARRSAARAMGEIDQSALPEVLRGFLDKQWVQVLAAVYDKHGADSDAWREHVGLARDLVWSVEPKVAPEDRQRLLGLLPRLLGRLNAGLDLIGIAADARAPLLDAFVSLHSSAMRGKPAGSSAAQPAGEAARSAAVRLEVQQDGQGAMLRVLRLDPPAPDGAALGLHEGALVRFRMPDDSARGARVAWVGPRAGLVLLTDPDWDHAIALAPEVLAAQLGKGQAEVVGREPLFEAATLRALRLYG